MNFIIPKTPIIILSTPRSGSTTLAYAIQKQLSGIRLFNEPFKDPLVGESEYNDFINYSAKTNQYIVKTHTGDLYRKDSLKLVSNIYKNNYFLIRVRRRNVCQQMVSYYIEMHRGIWGYYLGSYNEAPDSIPFDEKKIDHTVNTVLMYNDLSNKAPWNFDLDLWYEDLDLPNDVLVPTPKPTNYEQIENLFRKYQ